MGRRPPGTSSHPGKTTPGGKDGDQTSSNQNPATCNTHPPPIINRAARMEKPHPPNQQQCSIGPTVATYFREPITPKSRSGDPAKPTSGFTHDARHEAMAGPTQTPTFPATTTTRASSAHGRSPVHVAPRILLRTPLRPSIRATSTTLLTIPLTLTAPKPCTYDLYAGHHTASGGRSRTGPTGSTTEGGANPHVLPEDDEH